MDDCSKVRVHKLEVLIPYKTSDPFDSRKEGQHFTMIVFAHFWNVNV